jgi:hypothetical protein
MTGRKHSLLWRSGHVGGKRGLPLRRVFPETIW